MRAEIADATLHVQFSVGPNGHQPIVTDGARAMRAYGDSDAADFGTAALSRAGHAIAPAEALGTAIESFFHEGTRGVPTFPIFLRRAEERLARRRIDLADFN